MSRWSLRAARGLMLMVVVAMVVKQEIEHGASSAHIAEDKREQQTAQHTLQELQIELRHETHRIAQAAACGCTVAKEIEVFNV